MKILKNIGMGIFVIAFLYFGLKGFIHNSWTSPNSPTSYAIHGEDNRTLLLVFMPKNEAFLVHMNDSSKFIEAFLLKTYGSYGTHYFWNLWSLDNESIFGYRIYPSDAKPVIMDWTVINKFTTGIGASNLQDVEDKTNPIILIKKDAIRFENMWLTKEPTDIEFIKALSFALKTQKN